jgi:hypothetical protein
MRKAASRIIIELIKLAQLADEEGESSLADTLDGVTNQVTGYPYSKPRPEVKKFIPRNHMEGAENFTGERYHEPGEPAFEIKMVGPDSRTGEDVAVIEWEDGSLELMPLREISQGHRNGYYSRDGEEETSDREFDERLERKYSR